MRHEVAKWAYLTAGVLLLLVGLSAGAYGGWLLTHLEDPIDEMALRARLTESCKATAREQGYLITHEGTSLMLRESGLDDHRSRIYRAAWVVQGCEGFELESFCMGAECSGDHTPNGVSFKLTYSDSARRAD